MADIEIMTEEEQIKYQQKVNTKFVLDCNNANYSNVKKDLDLYHADINCMDPAGYGRAITYALKGCSGEGSEGEKIVKYLIDRGADINFKHGDKYRKGIFKPYFAYWAVDATSNVSDKLVAYIIMHSSQEAIYKIPDSYQTENSYSSVYQHLQDTRPALFKKLVAKHLIKDPKQTNVR